jgi:hypothetical protein
MAPKQSHTLEQIKPLDYEPLHTYFEARPTPAVMHVCRESRAEFLYRDDEAANSAEAAERKGHALYAPMFPNPEGKMVFFSFEADDLHLMSFSKSDSLNVPNSTSTLYGMDELSWQYSLRFAPAFCVNPNYSVQCPHNVGTLRSSHLKWSLKADVLQEVAEPHVRACLRTIIMGVR